MDRLEGFRGVRPEQIQRALVQAADNGRVEDATQILILGIEAEKFMLGLSTVEGAQRVGAAIIAECEATLRDEMLVLLEQTDLTSKEAKEAHYRARVAGAVLGTINGIISRGIAAAKNIDTEQQQ